LIFPREMWAGSHIKGAVNPRREIVKTDKEYSKFVNTYNGKMNVYTSVYDFEFFSENRGLEYSVILDRIFLDLDAHDGNLEEAFACLKKLHGWLGNIEHRMAFSGRGFYIFVYGVRASNLREIKSYFNICHDVTGNSPCLDTGVINNARLRRVMNTYHMQAGRWCIPLIESDLERPLNEILEMSKKGPRKLSREELVIGSELVTWPEVRYFDAIEVEIEHTESPGKLPIIPCLKNAIMVENPNHRSRVLLAQWYNEVLSELAILDYDLDCSAREISGTALNSITAEIVSEIESIAENEDVWIDYSSRETRKHVEFIVGKRYMAPSCHTLISEGYCVGKCWRYPNQ